MSISDVSEPAGLDRVTMRRCLLTLHDLGYDDYDGKFFTLTPRVLRLGLGARAAMPLAQVVQPWLDQLSGRIGQSTLVSILDGSERVCLARAAQRRVMSISLMPGLRLPAHCASRGRVLLAVLPKAEARAIVEASHLSLRTPRSLAGPDDIMQHTAEARRDGYAIIDQGPQSTAVPLYAVHSRVVAALNFGVAPSRPRGRIWQSRIWNPC